MRLSHIFTLVSAILFLLASLPLGWIIQREWETYHATENGLQAIQIARLAMVAAEKVSAERGPGNSLIGSPPDPVLRERLHRARIVSDAAIQALLDAQGADAAPEQIRASRAMQSAQKLLAVARSDIDEINRQPYEERDSAQMMAAVHQMFEVIPAIMEAVTALSIHAEDIYPQLSSPLSSARQATELREYAGRLGSQLTGALSSRRPLTAEERREADMLRGRIVQLHGMLALSIAAQDSPPATLDAWRTMEEQYFRDAMEFVDGMVRYGAPPAHLSAAAFASRYVPAMASMMALRDTMIEQAIDTGRRQHQAARRNLMYAIALGLAALLAQLALYVFIRRRVAQPLLQASRLLTDISHGHLDAPVPPHPRRDEIGDLLQALAILKQRSLEKLALEQEKQRLIDELTEVSRLDFLTGLPNRRAFTQSAQAEIARAWRCGDTITLILFDIDHFKQVNDNHGHDAGDAVLVHIAATIAAECRESDLIGRYGGEEFIALTTCGGEAAGLSLAERLRAAIEASPLQLPGGQSLSVTASFGAASLSDANHSLELLLVAADHALYSAKRLGRNRVEWSGS
ncbi:diguanylate cyclase [Chromobacterium sp. IIBBL 290-4]|uniref:diguanylate cyclase n=1 Tax=Chromobacterium sp. IIBBL 290-4 TaxID=2953890 RepID=UPI0020B8001E|nr:diguanylate cyclase [Chromobacterium sp. IIBBL 290-4]UTH72817.1 diguanylate cyclase [Chromobacterium sp. IIBBL 290-4]